MNVYIFKFLTLFFVINGQSITNFFVYTVRLKSLNYVNGRLYYSFSHNFKLKNFSEIPFCISRSRATKLEIVQRLKKMAAQIQHFTTLVFTVTDQIPSYKYTTRYTLTLSPLIPRVPVGPVSPLKPVGPGNPSVPGNPCTP